MKPNHEGVLYSEGTCLSPNKDKYSDPTGRKYDRVSDVIKRMGEEPIELNAWKARMGEMADVIGEETSNIGTSIHEVTALHDLGRWRERDRMMDKEPRLFPYFATWEEWVNEYVTRIIAVEVVVFDSVFGIAGTIDRVLLMKGDKYPSIGDIKTGTSIGWKKIDIQVAGAYFTMWNENREEWKRKEHIVKRAIIMHLPRWRTMDEISMGKVDKEITGIRVKEVTSTWAQDEWKRMRKEWKEMK